jgi:hypothetical protein
MKFFGVCGRVPDPGFVDDDEPLIRWSVAQPLAELGCDILARARLHDAEASAR